MLKNVYGLKELHVSTRLCVNKLVPESAQLLQFRYWGSVGFDLKRLVMVQDFIYLGHGQERHRLTLKRNTQQRDNIQHRTIIFIVSLIVFQNRFLFHLNCQLNCSINNCQFSKDWFGNRSFDWQHFRFPQAQLVWWRNLTGTMTEHVFSGQHTVGNSTTIPDGNQNKQKWSLTSYRRTVVGSMRKCNSW